MNPRGDFYVIRFNGNTVFFTHFQIQRCIKNGNTLRKKGGFTINFIYLFITAPKLRHLENERLPTI
jgi:hypothetical protein